ncbi:MAG: hypothetical protein HRU71_09280 [Planctomycetia bacterium]|nr:MAG: hypothetical protein HRU71_09280 [Planctomycetia bacterium]
MTTGELIEELVSALNGKLSREEVEHHVRFGRGHGYPDCCIRAFVLACGQSFDTKDRRYITVAGRRLCSECKARIVEQESVPHVTRAMDIEEAFSGLRTRVNDIVNERRKAQPDNAKIDEQFSEIKKWVNKICVLRTTPIDEGSKS